MAHPIEILDIEEEQYEKNLNAARVFAFLGILIHFGRSAMMSIVSPLKYQILNLLFTHFEKLFI